MTCARLRNAASDSQPACSDSGSHAHIHWPSCGVRSCERISAQRTRQAIAPKITSRHSQNRPIENSGIQIAVSAKPAAAHGATWAKVSSRLRSPVACQAA